MQPHLLISQALHLHYHMPGLTEALHGPSCLSLSFQIMLFAIASPVSLSMKTRNRSQGTPSSSTKRMLIDNCSVFAA